jgi:hypothetical protein
MILQQLQGQRSVVEMEVGRSVDLGNYDCSNVGKLRLSIL